MVVEDDESIPNPLDGLLAGGLPGVIGEKQKARQAVGVQ